MSFPYTEEMMESVKKVEATRAARMAAEPRRMTAEEKDALLEQYHPDYNLSSFAEIIVGPNKGEKAPKELVELLQAKSRVQGMTLDLAHPDYDVDVLVIGGGGSGASAAIEAFDNGAKVLILEKQPKNHLYNNTRMSGGGFHCPDKDGDPVALKEYAKAMFSGENIPWKGEGEQEEVSEGLAQGWAKYSPLNAEFLKMCDPEFHPLPRKANGAAFKNFPGAMESHYRAYSSSYSDKVNRYNAKDKPKAEKSRGEAFWNALYNGVLTRKIDVLYESPAERLLTNNDGEVIGITAKVNGAPCTIKANKAVILCSGGFEYNKAMRKAFLEGPGETGWAFYGSPDNTGDGIIMGLAVGAGLQKVGKAAARMIMSVPIKHHGLNMGLDTPVVGSKNSILVDNYGNRFCSETKVIEDPSRYIL